MTLTYRWQVSPGGDAGQCGNQGVFQVPITSFQVFGPMIRLDSDDRSGWCNLTFTISGRNDVELDIQLWPDGNAGRCVNYLPQGQYRTVRSGVPVTIGINADGPDRRMPVLATATEGLSQIAPTHNRAAPTTNPAPGPLAAWVNRL